MSKILHILKFPASIPTAREVVREYEAVSEPGLPSGWERMTQDEYAAWVQSDEAASWKVPVQAPMVPDAVSPWQMRRALNQLKLRDAVEAAVAAADQDTKDGWDYAIEIRRDNPLIAGMAAALGMDDAKLDDLFRLADSFK